MRPQILSIEDDPTTQVLIEQCLRDFTVTNVVTLKDAEKALSEKKFDIILLDIELPDGDGLKFYSLIAQREELKDTPVLFISSHDHISNKVIAFSVGADDFIAKPFNPLELSARVTAKIRKQQMEHEKRKVRRVGDLEIDFDRQKVFRITKSGQFDLKLTSIEIKILTLLSKRLEQVYSREQILNSVWGNVAITDRTVDTHVANLRVKLAGSSAVIETVKSFGYRLAVSAL